MENRESAKRSALDDIAKQELENLDAPYSANDWEKVEVLLANQKASKSFFNKTNFSVNQDNISGFKIPEIIKPSNLVFAFVIVIAVVVLLYRMFDNSSSSEQNIYHAPNDEAIHEENVVSGMDTLKTITQESAGEKDSSLSVTSVVKETQLEESISSDPNMSEKKLITTVNRTESKPTEEKKVTKVKMEVEEIEEIDIPSSRAASLIKRKQEKEVDENNQSGNSNTSVSKEPTTSSAVKDGESRKSPTQETITKPEETKREMRKNKRTEEQQRPKAFRELDTIQ